MLGYSFQTTPGELQEILARLRPYFPKNLKKVEKHPGGWLRYEFEPFTGREDEPAEPAIHSDPKLRYIPRSQDHVEYLLREKALRVLAEIYRQAWGEWKDAAYVADLKAAVKDAPALWAAYERERRALEAAFDYLRTAQAAVEWPSAISRLVHSQDRTKAAACAFDERGREIAEVHDRHLYAELGYLPALAAAGYPQAKDWHIVEVHRYGQSHSVWDMNPPLAELVRRRIDEQDAHIAKVGRLSGVAGGR
ncbi:hypothetical protein BJP40_05960 [Streptomyces sp. CC53]|uniref:hypothetical protein n=1 Tax=Streptomyces sp. CC53 TaxID=1906740 RepID=UPI0008DDFFD6|nr:hypothetical protein [Streptomyces sp. CC53]OII61316.1 hypothetical protein BJP40_05960 [Streptomyces sp. CC53]